MSDPHNPATALHLIQIFVSAFLAVLFLQSGFDKIIDRQGNLEWLRGHFAKSPLSRIVPLMVTVITIIELCAGILSAAGCIAIVLWQGSILAYYGSLLSGLAILALFLGQRLAKDYAGAATLVVYFLLTMFAVYILA